MASARYVETLKLLVTGEVEFLVVDMAAGILQGVPATTLDLDIVHRRTAANVERLAAMVRTIHGVARGDDRCIAPGPSHLLGPGHILLTTDLPALIAIKRRAGRPKDRALLPVLEATRAERNCAQEA